MRLQEVGRFGLCLTHIQLGNGCPSHSIYLKLCNILIVKITANFRTESVGSAKTPVLRRDVRIEKILMKE